VKVLFKEERSLEDMQIISLYWERSEDAITQTSNKYGRYCHSISYNILHNHEDADECVNDTYMNAWNSIPPNRPNMLSAFLAKITRNLSLKKYENYSAKKRGSGQMQLALEEIENYLSVSGGAEEIADETLLAEFLNRFLGSLPLEKRKIFMRRYWYFSSIKEIAIDYGMGESKVKMILLRTRNDLKLFLEQEGIVI